MRLPLALFFVSTAVAFGQTTPPPLWQKAVDIFAANLNWVPGIMTMQMEMLNKHGEPQTTNVVTYKIYAGENGEVQNELVSMINDGEDVTAKEKAKLAKQKKESDKSAEENSDGLNLKLSLDESPFHPDNQGKLTLTPRPDEKTFTGQTCRGFDYTLPLAENTRIGTAWLDTETGAPVRHEFTTKPLPPKVKEMINVVRYHFSANGDFYTTEATFEGVGGFLFIKQSFRGKLLFQEYWRQE